MEDVQKNPPDTGKYLRQIAKILYLLTICAVTITGFLNKDDLYEILKFNLLSIVLVTILIFYAKENRVRFLDNSKNLFIVIASYLFSLACIMLSFKFNMYNLWLIGPMVIAMLIDANFGLSFHLLFSFMLSVNADRSIDSLMYNFILGAIGCILSKYILDVKKIGYALVIFLSSDITLIVIMNNFMTQNTIDNNIVYSVISGIMLFGIAFMVSRIYEKNNKNNTEQIIPMKEETEKEEAEKVVAYPDDTLKVWKEERLNEILDENHELLLRLKEFSKKLYERSKYISDISYGAAEKINADEKLTRAGGMYSKIGRIIGKDYIVDGVKLLEEYQFPEDVIDIVKQHNLKFGNPESKEAAIVMITDSIIASMDAMKSMKESKNISNSKLIDGIFSLRLSKNNFEESGLSNEELKILKKYYIDEFMQSNK